MSSHHFPSKTTNCPLAHSLPSDTTNLSSDSTFLPTDSSQKDSKTGTGAECNQNEVGKIWTRGEGYRHATTIDILSDDILLEIFVFILSGRAQFVRDYPVWQWHKLVHVCRRWRQLVFASPLRLDLQLLCTHKTSVKNVLGCWPTLPLVIDWDYFRNEGPTLENTYNLFAALEQRNRVRHVNLDVLGLLLGELFAVMEEPFPALTHLWLSCRDTDGSEPVIPSELLGGSAPRLHDISFSNIPLLSIPTFLSSASDLVRLKLDNIPPSPISFPSPEEMVACLAALTKLEIILIRFQVPTTTPDQIRLPPETLVILPSVTSFLFKNDNAYLEDFVARINAPLLNSIDITYTMDVDFQVTELFRFMERSNLKPTRSGRAVIYFEFGKTALFFYQETDLYPVEASVKIEIESLEEDPKLCPQVAEMTMVLHQASALLSDVVYLAIESDSSREIGDDEHMDDTRWLELVRPFIAAESLRISYQFVEGVAHVFEQTPVEMFNQALPNLKSLHLEGPFVTSTVEELSNTFRRACGHPLIITTDNRW